MQSSVSNYAFTVAFPIFEINGDVFLRASSDFSAWGVSPLDCGWLGFRQYCCCPRGFLVQVSNLCVSSQSLPFPAARGDHPSPLLSQMFISPPLFSRPLPAAPSGPPLLRGLHFYRPFFRDSPECLPVLLCVPSTNCSFSYIHRAVLNLEGPQRHLQGMLAPAPELDSTGLG